MDNHDNAAQPLVEVKNLETSFFSHLGEIKAVRNSTFSVNRSGVLGVVGESGSGKSVTALSIMGLIDSPGRVKSGQIIFKGQDLVTQSRLNMNRIRGNEISMIFQDPMTSLNPVYTIENQMIEVLRRHKKNFSRKEAKKHAVEILSLVGIPDPAKRIKGYPHEFSGGMRQRAMIATALLCNPEFLIADEPTTALDVTIQAQILDLMLSVKEQFDSAIMIITHDLGVIAEICDNVIVMYGGTIMEKGDVRQIFHDPQNPYTIGLYQSVPSIENSSKRLIPIGGSPPDLMHPPKGCPFFPRCSHSMNICKEERPPDFNLGGNHVSACWLHHSGAPNVGEYRKGESQNAKS